MVVWTVAVTHGRLSEDHEMSANLNVTNVDAQKRILLIAATPATSQTTGWPVGFWWAELTHPYWVFTEAGYEVEIRSPRGGALQADTFSDPEDPSGYCARHPESRFQEVDGQRTAARIGAVACGGLRMNRGARSSVGA
jgi:putative intracellular protease/amidase